jgi:hypothetical protein
VNNNLANRPEGKKLFLSISPLNRDRSGLAPYWGEKDNLPLPKEWESKNLNDPQVKQTFLNFTLDAVGKMHPDYLAVGIELNVLLSKNAARWKEVKELYRSTYAGVKAKHPTLPVCFTTDVMHYRMLAGEAAGNQDAEVADLMKQSDLFAMSVYPMMGIGITFPFAPRFFEFATTFGKPIAVSESGMSSKSVELKTFNVTLPGSEEAQFSFTGVLLKTAAKDKYRFVINFATTDFDKLCQKLPMPLSDLARIWAFTGMQTDEKKPKPALQLWDAALRLSYVPVVER